MVFVAKNPLRVSRELTDAMASLPKKQRGQGFHTMEPERQREIAKQGGKASYEGGRGHLWNSETARIAGRKGIEAKKANALKEIKQ